MTDRVVTEVVVGEIIDRCRKGLPTGERIDVDRETLTVELRNLVRHVIDAEQEIEDLRKVAKRKGSVFT